MNEATINIPFNPITGLGLGVSYSSLNQIGEIFPQRGLGQAGILLYINMMSGNLVVKDRPVTIQELNGPLVMGFIYNSQNSSGNCWQFTSKRMTQVPIISPASSTAILQEEDGHLTTYTLTSANVYVAPGLNDGIPSLQWNAATKLWCWYHPKTKITEYYNTQGLLMQRVDSLGRATQFTYDQNNNVQQITGASGTVYQVIRSNNLITINQIVNGQPQALQSYTLNSQGQIVTTVTPSGYTTTYQYRPGGILISNITQSDDSTFSTLYAGATTQISSMRIGNDMSYRFTLPTVQNPNQAIVQDASSSKTTLIFDASGKLQSVSKQTGYIGVSNKEVDTLSYTYNASNQLQTVTHPDGSQTTYQYGGVNGPSGLMHQKTLPNGQTTSMVYANDQGCSAPTHICSKTQILNGLNLTTYYVYNLNYDTKNHIFLSFEISPTGSVTQYLPDAQGNIASIIKYLAASYANPADPTVVITIAQMQAWVALQNPQLTSRTDMSCNSFGQIYQAKKYANIDPSGNGIDDQYMGLENYTWDEFGNLLIEEILQQGEIVSTTNKNFDDLQRIAKLIDAQQNQTIYNYTPQNGVGQIVVSYPNARVDTTILEPSSLVSQQQSSATSNSQLQTRITNLTNDPTGRLAKTILPDSSIVYTFCDNQNRLGYIVSPLGIVTCNQYDRVHRYKSTTIYNLPINIAKLLSPINPNILPTVDILLPLIQTSAQDRTNYEFYDQSERLVYQVDEAFYVTQFIYDTLNRKTAKITYATALTQAQLTSLQSATPINLIYNSVTDRCNRYFYDSNNNLVGLQDAAGYVTQFIFDAGNRISKKIQYVTPVTPNLNVINFSDILPTPDPVNDATSYYFRDARGNCLAQVDPEHYLTLTSYLPCDLKEQSTRFNNSVAASWFSNPTTFPALPITSTEDREAIYNYDLLNRIVEINDSFDNSVLKVFDNMGNLTQEQSQDANDQTDVDADHLRSTQTQYDGWNQITAKANPFVAALITAITANQNLTPQQKIQQISLVWQNQSSRSTYNPTGLLLTSTDPLNNVCYIYYDAQRRPIFSVDPTGAVIQKTYNSFDETIQIRKYINLIASATLQTLTGGLITTAFQAYLNSIQDNANDEISIIVRDNRGQITQITDPEGYITTKIYNAFKEIASESIPVETQQPSMLVQYQYDPRGLKTQVQKTSGAVTITATSVYANLYGQCTQIMMNNTFGNQITQRFYDTLGRFYQEIDAMGGTIKTITLDAFDRALTVTDSLGNVKTWVYSQPNRTVTTKFPVAGVTLVVTNNVFGEKIQENNSVGASQNWQHAPDGQVTVYTDALNFQTTYAYNLVGMKESYTDELGSQTSYAYNGARCLITQIEDVTGLALTTTYQPNAFGNNINVIDPKLIVTTNTFDRRNLLLKSILDPTNGNYTGLNLITTNAYNGQGTQISCVQSSTSGPLQYLVNYLVDGFDRATGKALDPTGLNLTSTNVLDQVENTIAAINPYNFITRVFYDLCNRERFLIDAKGGVTETGYNSQGIKIYRREYATAVNPANLSNNTTLQQVQAMVTISTQDTIHWYFYDADGQECFKINSLGGVTEKIYNEALQLVQIIRYATAIDVSLIPTLTTAQLVTLMEQNASKSDKTTYSILDEEGQACFTISSSCVVSEKQFDGKGRIIAETTYATRVPDPASMANLTPAQFYSELTLDPLNDRTTYTVFDAFDNPQFIVSPVGGVSQFTHDANKNLTKVCLYATAISVPNTYEALVTLLNTLVPNPAQDRITQYQVDTANRNKIVTDPVGNTDQYNFNEVGSISSHVDKGGNPWNYIYDSVKRQTQEISPLTAITGITYTTTVSPIDYGSLTSTTLGKLNIVKNISYSTTSSSLTITQGFGLADARTCTQTFDACNLLVNTVLPNINIDNPAMPASYLNLPLQLTALSTQIVYDPRSQSKEGGGKMPVAMQDEAGNWNFIVYDAEKRPIYQVSSLGAVIATTYNTLGDAVKEVQYATFLTLDLQNYTSLGIPVSVLEQNLQSNVEADRTLHYEHDHSNNTVTVKEGPVFYCSPNAESPQFGTHHTISSSLTNAFGDCYYEAKLINHESNKKSETIRWFDRNGKLVAQTDANYHVIWYQNDVFGEQITRIEYAKPLKSRPSSSMTLAELAEAILSIASNKDRLYITAYNLLGQISSTIQDAATIQDLTLVNKIPQLSTSQVDVINLFQYNPTGKPVAVTYQYLQGTNLITLGTAYTYYDERDFVMATTDVARQSQDKDYKATTVIPLTLYSVNAFGQRVVTIKYHQGTQNVAIGSVLLQRHLIVRINIRWSYSIIVA